MMTGFFHVDEIRRRNVFFPSKLYLMDVSRNQMVEHLETLLQEKVDMQMPSRMKGYVSSLNMIAGNPAPGLGPLVAYPALKLYLVQI